MKIIMGSPVKGFNLKNKVKEYLEKQGHEVIDVGCYQTDKFVKFSSIAERIAKALQDAVAPLAISCCGSGTGANICANKFKNVSAVCCESELSARLARVVNDANCLCLGESVLTPEMACRIADVFISSSFQDAKGTPQNILDFWKEARNEAMSGGIDAKSREIEILYSARMKIKLLASQIADWIFFDPTDGRYEYRPKEDRENTATSRRSRGRRRSGMLATMRLQSFELGFTFLEGFRYLGIESLSECKSILKIFATKSLIFTLTEYKYEKNRKNGFFYRLKNCLVPE